ncbi:unnamed protein product [Caenorhabditis sp. 36 PRJEB53466]|nr:unnamed protein product [Caenorhabditis sp. 36 PRJEB53466]
MHRKSLFVLLLLVTLVLNVDADAAEKAKSGAESAGKDVKNGAESAGKSVADGAGSAGNAAVDGAKTAGNAAADGAKTAGNAVADEAKKLVGSGCAVLGASAIMLVAARLL